MEAADRYWQIALIIDRVDQDTSFEGQHGCQENCYSADRLQRSQTWKMRRKAPIIVRFFKYPQQCHTGPWRPQDCCEPLCSSHTCSAGWVADVTKEPAPSRVEKNKQPNMRKHDTHAQAHNVEYYPRCCGRCCWLKECTFDLNLSSGCSCRKYGWGLTLGVSSCSFVQHEAAWSCMRIHENIHWKFATLPPIWSFWPCLSRFAAKGRVKSSNVPLVGRRTLQQPRTLASWMNSLRWLNS